METKYKVLIFLGEKNLAALDWSKERQEYISMSGNTSHTSDDVSGFYENILDYYNVDDLSEIGAEAAVINSGSSEKNVSFIMNKLMKLGSLNLWQIETILPFALLHKCSIKKSQALSIEILGSKYSIKTDKNFNFIVNAAKKTDITLTMNDFTFVFELNGAGFSGDAEEIIRLNELLNDLKEKNKEAAVINRKLKKELGDIRNSQIILTDIIGSTDIKKTLENYVDETVNLSDYDIEVTMTDETCRTAIINKSTNQIYSFTLPYKITRMYTKKKFSYDLNFKIAKSLEMMNIGNERNLLAYSRFSLLDKGDEFEFGIYENTPIKWIVLEKKQDSLYVISKDVLFSMGQNCKSWENSAIRNRLNNEFYNKSFSFAEKELIYKIDEDYIRILYNTEIKKYIDEIKLLHNEDRWWIFYSNITHRKVAQNSNITFGFVAHNFQCYAAKWSAQYGVRPVIEIKIT